MNYKSFKKSIEKCNEITTDEYLKMVKKYGKRMIDGFFEEYLQDLYVKNFDNKFNLTYGYLEANESINEDGLKSSQVNYNPLSHDISKQYLDEIGKIQLLSKEEEENIFSEINKLKGELAEINYNHNDTLEILKSYGYKRKSSSNIEELIDEILYIENILTELKKHSNSQSVQEEITKLEKLKTSIPKYSKYKKLVNKFATANLSIVAQVAKRYINRGMDLLDLIQEGNIGLIQAIETFDVNSGYKFSIYKTWWIQQSILMSIADQGRAIKIPLNINELIKEVNLIKEELIATNGRDVTEKDITKYIQNNYLIPKLVPDKNLDLKMNWALYEERFLKYLKPYMTNPVSISNEIDENKYSQLEDDSFPVEDIEDNLVQIEELEDDLVQVEKEIIDEFQKEDIIAAVSELTPNQQLTLVMRMGFVLSDYMTYETFENTVLNENFTYKIKYDKKDLKNVYEELSIHPYQQSFQECCNLLGYTKQRIGQLERDGIRKLKGKMRIKALR